MTLLEAYKKVRAYSEQICKPLKTEDYVVQPVVDVSPPKWHLGHTTWFFETFLLIPNLKGYKEYDSNYNFVFNSYYETIGARVIRTDRGNLSRPSVEDIYKYRAHVDEAMQKLIRQEINKKLTETIVLGLNHEEQHQELLLTDIKYILGHNPLFPVYADEEKGSRKSKQSSQFLKMKGGLFDIGFNGKGFCFDNELANHKVCLQDFKISEGLVTNADYLQFMEKGGYKDFRHWHAEGWDWVKNNHIKSPLYWHLIDGEWFNYTLNGLRKVRPEEPVCHVSFYEAAAYASWKGMRLPTEFEWEATAKHFDWGQRW